MNQQKLRRYLKHGMLPQLSVFEAVARHGNYTKAGEELFMAQPTVSVQMKKLAETVGTPLVEQIGKRIYLTEAGKMLYKTANVSWETRMSGDSLGQKIWGALKRKVMGESLFLTYFRATSPGEVGFAGDSGPLEPDGR